MEQIWSWILTIALLTTLYLTGNNKRVGWLVGIASQVMWVFYSLGTKQYGFLVGCVLVGSMYVRNWIKWGQQCQTSLS